MQRLAAMPAALALPAGILTLIVLMILPIPTLLLDTFFVLNIALSVAILMAAMNAAKPLDFSSFPSVLLFAADLLEHRARAPADQEFDALIDRVRADLGSWLVGRVCSPSKPLPVVTLDAALESAILGGMRDPATGQPLVDPDLARMIGDEIASLVAAQETGALALVVQPPARRALASLLRMRAPQCLVISIAELPATQPIEVVAVIGQPETQSHPLSGAIQPEPLAA